jgi:L-glyceraldehyde 3-phosphate reductase
MGALDTAVRSGRALYAGISSYSAERTAEAAAILRALGTPLLIHQPSYSMLNRWIEGGLLDLLGREGIGCIAFSPLAQGVLTGKYLGGVPHDVLGRGTRRHRRARGRRGAEHLGSFQHVGRSRGSAGPRHASAARTT